MKHKALYIDIVETLKECSKDSRLKVGAILLKDERIVATGYNGQLPGQAHEPYVVDGHDVSTIHAEQNILMHCAKHGIATKGCEILVTHFPCITCTKLLIMAGITKVYYLSEYKAAENVLRTAIEMVKIDER